MSYPKLSLLFTFLVCAQFIYSQSEITTEKLIITDGASTDYILKSDAAGNATWVDANSVFTSTASNWTLSGTNLYNNNTGNVGIGTTNPTAKLQVQGDAILNGNSRVLYLEPGFAANSQFKFLRFGTNSDFYAGLMWNNNSPTYGDGDDFTIFTYGGRDIALNANGGDYYLMGNGNLGVGTVTPSSKLDVNGTLKAGVIQTRESRIEINDLGTGDRSAILDFHGSDVEPDFSARLWRVAGEDGNFRIENRGAGNLLFRTSNINRAAIQPDGKFIVGSQTTPTPGNYNLYVENGILTERVKIATVSSTDWADYVFEEDYGLMSLEEINSFVKENKHLPNVPSAAAVEKDGYELQQMDSKLLEKIEELYLLTIQLNKEKNELKQENELLKKSMQESNRIHQSTLQSIMSRLNKLENR